MKNFKLNFKKLLTFFSQNIGDNKPAAINSNGIPFQYLEDVNAYTSEIATANLFLFYIMNNQWDDAVTFGDYLVSNNLTFYDRLSAVPDEPITEGFVPYTMFLISYCFYRLYLHTENEDYLNKYESILNLIETDGTISGDVYNYDIPVAMLIYNNGEIIDNNRYGTYTSDVFPLLWCALQNSDNQTESFNFIKKAQDDYIANYSIEGLFYPYYIRNLPENYSIGTVNTWIFDGILGNEKNFYHQYKIFYNLASYYNFKIKNGYGDDYYLKTCIDKFFNLVYDTSVYPESISFDAIDFTREDISFNNSTIYFKQTGIDTILWTSDYNLLNMAIFAKACLLLYEVSNKNLYLDIVEDALTKILTYEQDNYSYKNDTYTDINTQINILIIFASYNNLIKKDYYTIINDVLRLLNLEDMNTNNQSNHQQPEIINILKDSVNELWGNDEYIDITDLTEIPSFIEPRWYMVLKYHMAWQLGLTRDHSLTDWFEEKYMQMFAIMSQRKDLDLIVENQMPYSIDYSSMNYNDVFGGLYV